MTQIAQPHSRESGPSADQVDVDAPHGADEIAPKWRRALADFVDWAIVGAMGCSTNCVIG